MRIAHLSDPHLLALDGARVRDFLNKRWIGGLNLLLKRKRQHSAAVFEAMLADIEAEAVDHVLCTGDITNLAHVAEARFASRLFRGLDLGAEHVTVIPGNHDAYVSTGQELFAEHFGEYFACDPDWQWEGSAPWPVVRVRREVAIIGLSTSRTTPWFTAWGDVGEAQLGRLEAVLGDPRLAAKLRLVAIHHPPVGKPARSRGTGLRDHAALVEVLARQGAELVLHGHEHMDLAGEIARPGAGGLPIPVRGIQSATFVGRNPTLRARYRIYEVTDSPAAPEPRRPVVTAEELRVWNPEDRCFETDREA